MTKEFHRNKQRNILHGKFKTPSWLCDRNEEYHSWIEDHLNGIYLDHLEKVADEEDVYECHLYDLWMEKLEKLIEGCKQRGLRMTIKAYSEYNPGNTIAIRFEKMDWSEKEFMESLT
jgi:hypothetical protein